MDHLGRFKGIASQAQLGGAVRELRRKAGLSQQELADLAGVSRLCVSDLERAARHTRTVNVLKILAALGYEIDLHPAPSPDGLATYVASFTDSADP